MRPTTIVSFEYLMFGTLGLGFIQAALAWQQNTAIAHPGAVLAVQAAITIVMLVFIILISQRGSPVATKILVALTGMGLFQYFTMARSGQLHGNYIISAIQVTVQLFALALLYTPTAREWMDTKRMSRRR